MTNVYQRIYGNIIQAFRPASEQKLLKYLNNQIGFRRRDKILDAGCGIGGPAIFFAKKNKILIDGITISGKQFEIANEHISKNKVSNRVKIVKGDYHRLTQYYSEDHFDGALFLESLGHASDPIRVINETSSVLKKDNSYIYIKDFFLKESLNPAIQEKVDVVIDRINSSYKYNTLRLTEVISALRGNDFEIEFIKKFDFVDDTTIRAAFEKDQQINIFEGMEEFWPAEWLEIRVVRKMF